MLFRKMLRDMKLNKTQFISIFLMAFLGVFIYAGVSSEWNGLQTAADRFYSESNLADVWVYSTGFSEEAANAVAKLNGVTGVERRLTIDTTAEFDNNPIVTLNFVEQDLISTSKLIEGETFDLSKEGIWLDSLFAKAKGLKLGDKVKFSVNGITIEKKIMGLIMNPEYVYAPGGDDMVPVRGNYGYGFLSKEAFPKEIPVFYTNLLITTNEKVSAELKAMIDEALGGKYSVMLSRDDMRSYMQFREEIKEHKAMGQIFPVVFLAVALLTIVTTMARLVNNQRTQIGVLKAMGFQRRRILYHYVSYGLWISLAGAVLGAFVGPLIIPYLFFDAMKTVFTLPVWRSVIPISVVYMAAVSVLVCTLITYLSCRNVLKDTPAQTLRPKAPKAVKHSFFDTTKWWRRLGFHTQWNLRDVFRCKGRSIMAIVGVLGCSALMICAFGMLNTFDYLINWNYGELNHYETKIELKEDISEMQINSIASKYEVESILEGAVELKANGISRSGELMVTDHVTLIQFVNENNRLTLLPEEGLSISYKMAELLEVKVGDTILWHNYGDEKWISSKVSAIYRTAFAQGISMTKTTYEEFGYIFQPTALLSSEIVTKASVSDNPGISNIKSKAMITQSAREMMQAMNILVYVLIVAAILLGTVVIYNLGVLSFTERQRELATLKVIGFKTKKLRSLLLEQNIWLTGVGILLGIPIGIWMIHYIFQFVGELFDFVIRVSLTSYLYSIAGTMLVSISMNRLFSKKVKSLDMVSSLKGVE